MSKRTHLRTLQYWMTEVVMGNGAYSQKLQAVEHEYNLPIKEVVATSNNIPIARRLWVYEAGFAARLLECLRADYPELLKFLTDKVFDQLARAYIYYEKPESYTLFDLGKGFPSFLEKTLPSEKTEQLEFVVDLARYERTFLEVVRAKGMEKNDKEEGDNIATFMHALLDVENVNLSPCLQLLELNFPIKMYLNSSDEDKLTYQPISQNQYLGISRKNYRMMVMELEAWQFHLLRTLQEDVTMEKAIQMSASKTNLSENEIFSELVNFTHFARENGIIF